MEIKELLRFVSLIAIVHLSNTILTRKPGDVRNILFTSPLTTNRVEELLQRAREVSFRQRRQYNETRKTNGRMTSRCLLSLHHGTYRSGQTKDYTKATDMLRTMRSLMFEDGYSPEYLQTKAAMWTFERVQGFECDLPNPGFCDFTSRYRTPDGSCNNIANPRWGMAGMIQRRIVKSAYDDTFGLPRRRGVNNVALPEPRHISNAVHFNPGSDKKLSYENKLYFAKSQFTNHDVYMTPKSKIDDCCEHGYGLDESFNIRSTDDHNFPDICALGFCEKLKHPGGPFYPRDNTFGSYWTRRLYKGPLHNARDMSNNVHFEPSPEEKLSDTNTLYVFAMGQFIDHDIAMTPESEINDCCEHGYDLDNCFNIIITEKDKFSNILVPGHCMEVKRSAALFCPDATSNNRPRRQQMDAITSFVDASNVYGSDAQRQTSLRDDSTGFLLKVAFDYQLHMIRIGNNSNDTCTLTEPRQQCSRAGDLRVDEVPTLSTIHFLFVLEHNRIANKLKNFYADTETIFQETRRIVIAMMQKIVYDEFLPAVVSPQGMHNFQLASSSQYIYEPDTDPTMINPFGIAFRFGHSMIPQQMILLSRDLKQEILPDISENTEETFFNPKLTYAPLGYERLANYLSAINAPKRDHIIEEAVRSRLFIDREAKTTFDLVALNIQRGRDHGLPSYNEYRKWCGLTSVDRNWNNNGADSGLTDHSLALIQMLREAGYDSPQDIDLFVGGISEQSLKGGSLGPTFECLIGAQFRRMKYGDRFWFQNKDAGFNEYQIAAIRRYSLSKILCNNYNFAEINYPSVFKVSDRRVPCSEIPDLDLAAFIPGK